MRHLICELWRFGVVGVLGFIVDGGILFLLVSSGTDPYLARAVSFPVAVTVTWHFNRGWTFAAFRQGQDAWRQYRGYIAIQVIGASCNYGCYAIVLRLTDTSATGALVSLAIGASVGLIVNFLGARVLVFTFRESASIGDSND